MPSFHLFLILSTCLSLAIRISAADFVPPKKLLAGDKVIDVQRIGHSAPFLGDVDGDGQDDLLVGEYYEGRLRIFRNVGSNHHPKFDNHEWFQAGGALGRVPEG